MTRPMGGESRTRGAGERSSGGAAGEESPGGALAAAHARDKLAAGSVIGAHTLQHTYQHGFYVIVPELYTALGLTPVAAGALEMVRRFSGGAASLGGGVLVDRFPHKRVPVLYLSLIAMGLGYLLVGVIPVYVVILAAAGLATAAGAVWHPAALSLLSQRYPARRGFMIALHRSSGSVGDFVGPLLVGGLLVVLMWRDVLYGALPLALLFALGLWVILRRATGWQGKASVTVDHGSFVQQVGALRSLLRVRSLQMLLLVAGLSGFGQGGLLLWLGLYLQETQGMGSLGIGAHVALLTVFGIVAGPMFGMLSDRIGRKPVIIGVLAAKTAIAVLMALAGGGLALTLLVGLMGTVMFGVNSLVQAGALDVADGRGLEGSTIGMLWGINALFVGASPLFVGFLVEALGFGVLFWYVAAMNAVALATAFALPSLNAVRRQPSAGPG